jgi:HK97 family phage major capsid protein
MTLTEQVKQHESSRSAKVARREAIIAKCGEDGRTPDASEKEDLETLAAEIRSHEEYLDVLAEQVRATRAAAQPVDGTSTQAATQSRDTAATQTLSVNGGGTQTRSSAQVVRVRANTEPGIGMARVAMALLRNRGDRAEAIEDIRQTWPDQANELELQLRAPVLPATTGGANWAAPLVQPTTLAGEFLEFLRPRTLLGRIPGLRQVDFNSRVLAQTGAGTYNWVGEGKPKPITALALNAVQLAFNKIAGIIVLTEETIKYSTPSAERIVRDDMVAGIANFMDNQFLDPTITAVAGIRPASITNGVAGTAAGGTTEAAARADIRALLGGFIGTNIGLNGVVLLANPAVAFNLGTMVNALGQTAFPGINMDGGNLLGVPVITSNATALASQIVAVHAPSIMVADDGSVSIDMSREASLEMESTPADPVIATTVLISLYQQNLVGLRAERNVTWLKARADSVRRIHTVAYA